MITFDQLSIAPSGKHLIIEARVDDFSYFDDVEIDSIVIDSQDTYVPNGPSSNPVFVQKISQDEVDKTYSIPEDCGCNPVLEDDQDSYCFTEGEQRTRYVKLLISETELGIPLKNSMLFVYVIAKGYPSPDTPCGYDNSKVMGVVVNLYPYYQSMMSGVKEISDTCNIPRHFINNILRFKAIELSIKTGNYLQAIKYWKKFFSSDRVRSIHKLCGCYGRDN